MENKKFKQWEQFNQGEWTKKINVRDFIQLNYEPYIGDEKFLSGPTLSTQKLCKKISKLVIDEKKAGGVLGIDKRVSSIDAFKAGYIDKELEKIVGLQTEKPFIRGCIFNGGLRTLKDAAEKNGQSIDPFLEEVYSKYRVTQNEAIFNAYTDEMKIARKSHIITGLPDAYSRGRIIGDYRRVALYGIDFLIQDKKQQKNSLDNQMSEDKIRLREEIQMQIFALNKMKSMAKEYGFDISLPAANAKEAIQWTYFGYLAAIKEQNGAAMSIGRVSTFFDIYINRDLKNKTINEDQAQELIDHFVMKLRIVKFLRTPAYDNIFAGDPVWATESIGGMGIDGRTLVTKTSFRILNTLTNMGPSPEPNLTVLWSDDMPENFKLFCANKSIETSSVQYESDNLMKKIHGDDYSIACCVSPMRTGKDMQFFGARANIAKALLYSINSGVDELHHELKMPNLHLTEIKNKEILNYKEIYARFLKTLNWLASLYVNTLNVIHYMHDKYNYESAQMALYDRDVHRFFATGIAGLSVVADSLSAIKYAKVKPIWKDNVAVDFVIEGDYPKYGNDDNRVDKIAINVVDYFIKQIRKIKTYRNSEPTMSILTITSNVMYGNNTGSTPDGRKVGEPFAPGANPMHGRDCCGAIASLSSVAKLPFSSAADGISNTFTIIPEALGKNETIEK